jgi:hypothetical protein
MKWEDKLLGRKFTLVTDHQGLKCFETVTAYVNNCITEVGRGPRFDVGEVKAEVWVKRGLDSAYGLHPPLCASLRFRDKDKRRGSRTRDRVFRIYLWSKSN